MLFLDGRRVFFYDDTDRKAEEIDFEWTYHGRISLSFPYGHIQKLLFAHFVLACSFLLLFASTQGLCRSSFGQPQVKPAQHRRKKRKKENGNAATEARLPPAAGVREKKENIHHHRWTTFSSGAPKMDRLSTKTSTSSNGPNSFFILRVCLDKQQTSVTSSSSLRQGES